VLRELAKDFPCDGTEWWKRLVVSYLLTFEDTGIDLSLQQNVWREMFCFCMASTLMLK